MTQEIKISEIDLTLFPELVEKEGVYILGTFTKEEAEHIHDCMQKPMEELLNSTIVPMLPYIIEAAENIHDDAILDKMEIHVNSISARKTATIFTKMLKVIQENYNDKITPEQLMEITIMILHHSKRFGYMLKSSFLFLTPIIKTYLRMGLNREMVIEKLTKTIFHD